MMKISSQIQPHTLFGVDCTYMEVNVNYIIPNVMASVQILLQESQGGLTPHNLTYEMTGTEYTAWGNDDNYVMVWALAKLAALPHPHVITLIPAEGPEEA